MSSSSRGSRVPPHRGNMRNTRSNRNVLYVDYNALPRGNRDHGGSSARVSSHNVTGGRQGGSTQPVTIDVEAFDDEIFISSPRAFEEAKNNSRRNRQNTVVVDVDSEERTARDPVVTRHYKRRRVTSGQAKRSSDTPVINLEGSSNSENVDQPPLPPSPPPPQEKIFKCPVCLGQLEDATSTKCGHIFCKDCLVTALAAQGKCPTCRKRSNMKNTFRIYLPATD